MANQVSKIAFESEGNFITFFQTCCSHFFPLEYILSRKKVIKFCK